MSTLGERIKQLRIEQNLTQEEMAQKLNISKSAISLYETNTREPSISVLISLAKLFDVSADYLLGLSGIKSSATDKKYLELIASSVIKYLHDNNHLK